ncbi:MAG: 7-carboxy-7-deazaguanine synthase QueE [Candidatus Bathyarchaeia archaeon]
MKLSEIFASIQGEGVNAGVPAAFLRTALCNLRCAWCDSRYTWDFTAYSYKEQVHEVTVEGALERIGRLGRKHLVITGGEPLLQQEELTRLTATLKDEGYFIEVETNGTIIPNPRLLKCVDQWNISPKTASSKNRARQRENPSAYRFFARLANAWFKFAILGEEDVREVLTLASKYKLPTRRILLMPEAATRRKLASRSGLVAELCLKYGFRFSPRLHIELWGGKRGT